MAKITYTFVNPGMASDDDTPASLVARKQVLAFNKIGRTLSSMGGIVKDIESIELARIKDDNLRDKLERRRAQRERDQAAEDAQEMNALSKKDPKPGKGKVRSWLKGKKGVAGFLKDQLPLWAKMMLPIVEFFGALFAKLILMEGFLWISKEENQEKLATFFHKLNVVFTKLGNFSNWLFRDKLKGGYDKLTGKESTMMERVEGLWDMVQGLSVLTLLTNPLSSLAMIATGIGWFFKNITDIIRKKPGVKGVGAGGLDKKKTVKTNKQRIKSSQSKTSTSGKGIFDGGKTPSRAPVIPNKGDGVKPPKNILSRVSRTKWAQAVNKVWKGVDKIPVLKQAKRAAGPVVNTVFWGLNVNARLSDNQTPEKAVIGATAETAGGWLGGVGGLKGGAALGAGIGTAIFPGAGTVVGGILGGVAGAIGGSWAGSSVAGTVADKAVDAHEDKDEKTKWWNPFSWGKKKSTGGAVPVQRMFLGGIVKGISKAVSGVVKGVSKAVSGVVKGVTSIASNPIIGTALSFIPGMQIPMAIINGVGALQQGNIMGALSAGLGGLGAFANINTVNAISQPQWLQNLRFSSFGQGVANMYHSGAAAFGRLTTGWNNFMGTDLGKLGKGVFTGLTGGGWGGAMSQFGSMTGMTAPGGLFGQGGFFGEGGRMAGMGDWLQKHNLAGIGNMFPGLSNFANSIPGLANLPGISDLFAGSFSPQQFIGGMAEKNGMGGLYKSVMGLLGGGDLYTGLKEIGGELGISPEVFGAVDQGKSLYERAKKHALHPDPVELLPILVPIIKDQVVIAPKVKQKAVVYLDAAQSMMNRV